MTIRRIGGIGPLPGSIPLSIPFLGGRIPANAHRVGCRIPNASRDGENAMFSISRIQALFGQLRRKGEGVGSRLFEVPAIRLIVRTAQELGKDDASHMAAGVAYYAILSLFPLMLGLIALLSLFLRSDVVHDELFEFFGTYLPASTTQLEDNIDAINNQRGALGLFSILGLFWTGSAVFGAISRAVNRAWDVHQDRPFYIAKPRQLAMAMGVGILFLLSVSATTAIQILGRIDLPVVGKLSFLENTGVNLITRVLPFVFTLAIFLAIYKFIPNTRTFWRYVWPGALLAAVLFEVGKSIFVYYLDNFSSYEVVYGSIGSLIAMLAWIYISAFILLVGAEFSSEYGRMVVGVAQGTLIEDVIPDHGGPRSPGLVRRSGVGALKTGVRIIKVVPAAAKLFRRRTISQ